MDTEFHELDIYLRKVAIKYLFFVFLTFLFHFAYYLYQDMELYQILTVSGAAANLFFIWIPYKLKYESIKPLIPLYLTFISLALYPFVLLYWQTEQITAFMWYFVVPLGAMIFLSTRTVIFWSVLVCILMVSIFVVSAYIPNKSIVEFTQSQVTAVGIMTIISCIFLISYSLLCINKVNQIKILESNLQFEKDSNTVNEEIDIEKYNDLYKQILDFFDKEKPFCDPDFNVSQLAQAINSNTTYISKAISLSECANFNTLVNTYRINRIKEMLNSEYQNKYTMTYIYTSAGFRHQSTFNKVFKQIEGVTPSEYMKEADRNKKD